MNTLDWNNYLEIANLINDHEYVEKWMTPTSLVTYKYYGIDIKFLITDNREIVFFINYKNSNNQTIINNKWHASQVFYFDNSDINELKKIITNGYNELNNCHCNFDSITFANISPEMIDFFNLEKNNFHLMEYVSNYIYETINLKTFAGKKMQKKRNHLNAFINNNYNYKIVDIKEVNQSTISTYLINHMNNFSDEYRDYELDIYKIFIEKEMYKSQKYKGIVIFIDNEIVGLTLGYEFKNTYEIIIEKANKNIRGLYQFVIKSNLNFFDINTLYIDRQDDAGLENLAISKHSYYPKYEIRRYYNVIS